MQPSSRLVNFCQPLLPLVIRLMALGFGLFFATLAMHTLLIFDFGKSYLSLVRWGTHGDAYELMICTIYLVWAAYLWKCAKAPLSEKTFLDFTVVANVAHFGVMFIQGMVMEGEHQHLAGDVLLGWIGLLIFMMFWLPVRHLAK